MKNFITLLILLISTANTFSQITNDWKKLDAGTTKNINDIYFQSPDTGYIVGDNYLFKKTTDGGKTWVDLIPPNTGERQGNNGNIIGIGLHNGNNFGSLDSGLYLAWEQPLFGVFTDDDGGSYSNFIFTDTNALCEAAGFQVLPAQDGNGYIHLITYGSNCNNVATYTNFYDGPFSVGMVDSAFSPDTGKITSVAVDSFAIIMGHNNGNLLRTGNIFSTPSPFFLDNTGVSAVGYAGNHTWLAATARGIECMFISTDSGKTFSKDPNFPQTFHYPVVNDFAFLKNGNGLATATSNGASGVIIHRDSGTWFFQNADYPLRAAQVFENGTAYVAGDNGLIMKTVNPDSTIGLKNISVENSFQIFPNPVKNILTIKVLDNRKIDSIELYDSNGRLIRQIPGNAKSIDFSDYAKGLYILNFITEGEQFSKKIVVE